jgi:site-specific recombinase XerD
LEWRFKVDGHEYSHITDLADTARNRIKAQREEAEARRLVMDGRGAELRITVQPFSSAAEAFERWAEGEYSPHPNSWKRLKVSMTSAKVMFGKRPLSSVTRGDIEDYKSWRRTVHKVREVTLRHDLHALSLLFQYAQKHNWCKGNPIEQVEIPSDKDAVRINVLSPAQEMAYFAACESLRIEKSVAKRTVEARGLQDMADLHTLMLLQGCRPEELRELAQSNVDLEAGRFYVSGKSEAAKRWLRMRAEARDIFARRIAAPGKWVFPSHKAPGKHLGQCQRLQAAVIKRSGVSCVPYDFRHTFATRAVERGIDLPTLAAIMGHANLRSIMKYVHIQQSHMDVAFGKLDLPAFCPLPTAEKGEQEGKAGNVREASKLLKN